MLSTDNRAELGDILTDIGDYLDDNPPALSLPPAAYTSSELWQLERERIFNRSWMLVAHVDQLAKTGDYVTVSVAGEPVMVVRDVDGQLHALSPICRHRLMLMVEPGAGRIDTLTCQYHLWRYGLDGRLRGRPYGRQLGASTVGSAGFRSSPWPPGMDWCGSTWMPMPNQSRRIWT